MLVNPLQDIPNDFTRHSDIQHIGIINMPTAVGHGRNQYPGKVKGQSCRGWRRVGHGMESATTRDSPGKRRA